jgi:hypothetical protein
MTKAHWSFVLGFYNFFMELRKHRTTRTNDHESYTFFIVVANLQENEKKKKCDIFSNPLSNTHVY